MNDETRPTETVDPYAEGTEHEYAAIRAPNLQTRVTINGVDVPIRFNRGVVKVDGPVAKEMDRCIAQQIGGLYQHVRKMDREAAIALAKQHAAGIRSAAAKGGMTSKAVQDMRSEAFRASGHQLAAAAPNNPEDLAKFSDELSHDALLITELQRSNLGEHNTPPTVAKPSLFAPKS